jgi:hypothetical protein
MEFVILALGLQRGGIVPRWWLGLPSLRAADLRLAAFAALTIGSVLINLAPAVGGARGGPTSARPRTRQWTRWCCSAR